MSVIDMTGGDLGPTLSYTARRWTWVPADPAEYKDHRIGSLTLVCQKGKRGRGSDDVNSYGVQEVDKPNPDGIRAFLFKSDTDPDQSDVYECVVGSTADGLVVDRCTCKAAQCKVPTVCKHICVVNKMIEEGVL